MPTNALPCDADPELWFSPNIADQVQAAALCEGCPLQVQCARLGLISEYGVFGGVLPTDPQRVMNVKRIKRERKEAERLELVAAVATMTMDGMSRSQIADRLGVGPATVGRIRAAA